MVTAASKILLRTLLSVLVLIVLTGLVLVGAVSRGPVSLSFVIPYANQVLADQYPDVKLGFEELELLWDSRDKNLVFAVTDVSVGREGDTIAVIPAVTVTFSQEALFAGRLAPSGLEFTGLKVLLKRTISGDINLGYTYSDNEPVGPESSDAIADSTVSVIHELIAGLDKRHEKSELTAFLQRLEVYNSSLYVEDEKQDKIWRVSSVDLVLWRTLEGIVGRLQGDAHIGDETINLVANAAYKTGDKSTVVNVQFFDFPLPILAKEIPELDKLKGFSLPISGDINISLDSEFQPVQVGFRLQSTEGQVDMPDLYKKPLQLRSILAEGHSEAPFNAVNLNSLIIQTVGPKIDMSGSFIKNDKGFGMSIEGSVPRMPTNDLGLYWPYSAAVDGYNWVTKNIRDGYARDATFRVELPPGALETGIIPDGAVELKFSFEGLSTDYFSPLPKVTNISGSSILTEKQIHVFDMTGQLLGMTLPEGDALIYDFDKADQTADISIRVNGENKQIFEFLDRKPLELVNTFGIDAASMKGTGDVWAQFVFPLKDDLTLDRVFFDAKGEFEDVYISNVFEQFDLSEGRLSATVTPKLLTVGGPARIEGIEAEVNFQAWLKEEKAGVRRYEVLGKLTEADRKKLNIDTEYLKGPVATSLGIELDPKGHANGVVTLNLLNAALEAPKLQLSKPAGVDGLLGAQLQSDGQGNIQISNIRLSSEPVNVVAEASIDKEGLAVLNASKISYGENDIRLNVQRKSPNNYVANVRGRVFDLRPFIIGNYSLNEDRSKPSEDPLAVILNMTLDTALLARGVSLKNVTGYVDVRDGSILQSDLKAQFSEQYGISYVLNQSPKGRHFEFISNQAGLLLQGLDLYENAREGTLTIKADIDDSGAESVAKGWVDMKDIRVVNAPVLGKILTIGSLGGIVDLLKNEGMTFATVEGPFTYENGLISTQDFRAVGSIGITVTGKIDQPNNTLDLYGTVIPSYTLNSMLGNIPILGRLLVGRKGEGIFGFAYKVNGSTDDPKIGVNPVSALAPGILRRMFFEPWDAKIEGEQPPDVGDTIEQDNKP